MLPQLRSYWPALWAGGIIALWLLPHAGIAGRSNARPAPEGYASRPQQETGIAQEEENAPAEESDKANSWYSMSVEKRKLKLMLAASIAIVAIFFIAVLLLSLLRMSRQYRQWTRMEKKRRQTDYIDAWSRYRLKDGWEKELPDE